VKARRSDWIDAAIRALADRPIDELKVLSLADSLGVARSSFYSYFEDRTAFLEALLEIWGRNTVSIVERSRRDAPTIAAACLGVFECWADERLYSPSLDIAVREWGRRSAKVANLVRRSDDERLAALTDMFVRYGCQGDEALVRARLVYHNQVGYYATRTEEPVAVRLARVPAYLRALVGSDATREELAAFEEFLRS
jgi:AcrR family transcriptional regulator